MVSNMLQRDLCLGDELAAVGSDVVLHQTCCMSDVLIAALHLASRLAEGLSGWDVKYYKGLGTSSSKEAKEYFAAMNYHCKQFVWEGAPRILSHPALACCQVQHDNELMACIKHSCLAIV